MTKQLMTLANGKVVLVLEGGYDLPSICDASETCVGALLGDKIQPIRDEELRRRPHESAVDALQTTLKCQGQGRQLALFLSRAASDRQVNGVTLYYPRTLGD